jgi:hypothetical protein
MTVALLIAGWLLTPELLCLIPGVEMTAREHECCEKMGSDCGRIPMPDMHTCCRTTAPSRTAVVARTADYLEFRSMILPAVMPDLDHQYNNAQSRYRLCFDSPTTPPLISQIFLDTLRI